MPALSSGPSVSLVQLVCMRPDPRLRRIAATFALGLAAWLASVPALGLVELSGIGKVAPGPAVTEFYNSILDNYFITADPSEAAAIDYGSAGPGWRRTGHSFLSGGSAPACRFYGSLVPGPNSHFYTADAGECAYLKTLQASTPAAQKRWNFESNDFYTTRPSNGSCQAGLVPVFRAYNNGFARGVDSNHRITTSQAAIAEVVGRGWTNEGVVMCAPDPLAPPGTAVAITGRVVSNPGGAPLAAAKIFDGARGVVLATTDDTGSFSFEYDGAASPLQVSLQAAGHLTRETRIARTSHRVTIDLISLAPPFDLTYYRQLARNALDRNGSLHPLGLQRWLVNPSFYIQTNLVDPGQGFRDLGKPAPQYAIDLTVSAIPIIVSEITAGRLQVGAIAMGPGALHINEPGWISIRFFDRDNNPQPYSGIGGNFGSGTQVSGLAVLGVKVINQTCPPIGEGLIFHEVGHAMGLFHIPADGIDKPNVMGGGVFTTGGAVGGPPLVCLPAHFSALERFHSAIMYSRPRGNVDPDADPPDFSY